VDNSVLEYLGLGEARGIQKCSSKRNTTVRPVSCDLRYDPIAGACEHNNESSV